MHCVYCGKQISDDAQFCAYCGRQQPSDPKETVQTGGETGKRIAGNTPVNKLLIGALVVGALALDAVVLAFFLPKMGIAMPELPFLTSLTASDNQDSSNNQQSDTPVDPIDEPQNDISDNPPISLTSDDYGVVSMDEASIGDVVRMGNYPPDDSYREPIDWVVIDEQDGHLFLLSKKAIDCRPISKELSYNYDINWERSDVRSWLNGSFLNSFDDDDLARIDTTLIDTTRDDDVHDRVFLLSMSEYNSYVKSDARHAEPTSYAIEKDPMGYENNGTVYWWLRDYNLDRHDTVDDNHFAVVFSDGRTNDLGYLADTDDLGIRPAMWVNRDGDGVNVDISTGVFYTEEYLSDLGDEPVDVNYSGNGTEAYDSTEVETPHDYHGDNTVYLEVEAQDGSTLSGYVRRDGDDYVIANSSDYEYSMSELEALGLSDAELCIAWNEPFARLGYHFKNSGLQNYFAGCSWYVDRGQTFSLTGAGARNNALLREIAERNASSVRWESLATC